MVASHNNSCTVVKQLFGICQRRMSFIQILGMQIWRILPEDVGGGGVYPHGWTGLTWWWWGGWRETSVSSTARNETESSVLKYSSCQAVIGQTC